MTNPRTNIAISCECGWVGIATSFSAATSDHLLHQLSKGEGHSAITHTNVEERMCHPEFSILRHAASQGSLDYRAKRQVVNREEFRLRRAGDMMAPLFTDPDDDGLGCARGIWNGLLMIWCGVAFGGIVALVVTLWKGLR